MKLKLLVFFGLGVFVRFFMLGTSTHFLSDESRDLVNIHQIWVEKKLTLVGPISDDRSHVFSSLTYYMLLPFALMGNFDPLGTVVGAAVWGVITGGLMTWLVFKHNPKLLVVGAALAATWFPLVQTSRWPWNPNLLLFWVLLGLLFASHNQKLVRFGAGLAFGLAVHHHWLAVVPAVLIVIKKRDLILAAGIAAALAPFVIFDWRHPPGIFVSRMIDYNRGSMGQRPWVLLTKVPAVFQYLMDYVFGQKLIIWTGTIATCFLAMWDMVKKSSARGWLGLWVITLLPLVFYSRQSHYLLPVLPFWMLWLFTYRAGMGQKIARVVIILLIIGSSINLHMHFEQPNWEGNLKILRGGTEIIGQQIKLQKLTNPNLAVLASPDIYPSGKKYRDLLLVANIRVKPYEEYETSDNLFVVTKADETTLRKDPAAELAFFKNGPVTGVWEIMGTGWRVVQFNRY